MAARRIGKYVPDWVKLATKCPEAERPHYNRLRTNFENIKTQLDGVAPKPEPINWDLYAKNISKPGMVDAFKKAYGAVTVPYPIDTLTSKINEAEKEMVSSEYINKSGYLGKANSNVLFFCFFGSVNSCHF